MSLIDITELNQIRDDVERVDLAVLARRRAAACDAVDAELASGGLWADEPAVAIRSYGEGCLVVGVTGSVDRAMAHRLGALLLELRSRSFRELMLTFARLGRWDPQLVRMIGQARIHRLIDGGHLEVHGATLELAAALGPMQVDTIREEGQPPTAQGRELHLEQGRPR